MGLADVTQTINEGAVFLFTVTLTDADDDPIDITNATGVGEIREGLDPGDTLIETLKVAISDPTNGQMQCSLTAAETEALTFSAAFPNDQTRDIQIGYYDVTVTLNTGDLAITGVDTTAKTFTFASDITATALGGSILTVSGSTGNDGTYSVLYSTESGGSTTVFVDETVPSAVADGNGAVTRALRAAQGPQNFCRRVQA